MSLYISALREDRNNGRIKNWGWIDTRDMLANPLTKLDTAGTIEWADLRKTMMTSRWSPAQPYKIDRTLIYPAGTKKVQYNDNGHEAYCNSLTGLD